MKNWFAFAYGQHDADSRMLRTVPFSDTVIRGSSSDHEHRIDGKIVIRGVESGGFPLLMLPLRQRAGENAGNSPNHKPEAPCLWQEAPKRVTKAGEAMSRGQEVLCALPIWRVSARLSR